MGMDMNGVALRGFADKARALAYRGEEDGGSEIVQVVIALGFAVGLGAALMILQTQVNTAITSAGNSVTNMFKSVTSGAGGKQVAALSRPAGSRARIDGASAVTFVMALPC